MTSRMPLLALLIIYCNAIEPTLIAAETWSTQREEYVLQLDDEYAWKQFLDSLKAVEGISITRRARDWIVIRTAKSRNELSLIAGELPVAITKNLQSVQARVDLKPVGTVTPNDELYSEQWALESIHAPAAWTRRIASPITVAVIDSGCDICHDDLKKNVWINLGEYGEGRETNCLDDDGNGFVDDVHGWNFVRGDSNVMDTDTNSHGTHCAGIIGASGNNNIGVAGVAWNVRIMPLVVMGNPGGSFSLIADAIRYAVLNGAAIINISLTANDNRVGNEINAVGKAIGFAETRGVLVVCAAGNNKDPADVRSDNDRFPVFPASFANSNIISVIALNEYHDLATVSHFGRFTCDIAAPGGDAAGVGSSILSTASANNYTRLAGTSSAAAYVSGCAALVWGHPALRALSPAQLKEVLVSTSLRDRRLSSRCSSGGRVDISFLNRLRTTKSDETDLIAQLEKSSIVIKEVKSSPRSHPIVAILDTGIDYDHSFLRDHVWCNPGESGEGKEFNGIDDDGNGIVDDVHGANFTIRDRSGLGKSSGDPMDYDGHGTHVAGIVRMVCSYPKEDRRVRLMAVKIAASRAGGALDSLLLGIDYAIANGAQIINCSFGFDAPEGDPAIAILQSRLTTLQRMGVVLVCSAGNSGENLDGIKRRFPASFDTGDCGVVLTVMGIDGEAGGSQWKYSGYGRKTVSFAAPVEFLSAAPYGGVRRDRGTSMAAAVVSGALARCCSTMGEHTTPVARLRITKSLRYDDALENSCRHSGILDLSMGCGDADTE